MDSLLSVDLIYFDQYYSLYGESPDFQKRFDVIFDYIKNIKCPFVITEEQDELPDLIPHNIKFNRIINVDVAPNIDIKEDCGPTPTCYNWVNYIKCNPDYNEYILICPKEVDRNEILENFDDVFNSNPKLFNNIFIKKQFTKLNENFGIRKKDIKFLNISFCTGFVTNMEMVEYIVNKIIKHYNLERFSDMTCFMEELFNSPIWLKQL